MIRRKFYSERVKHSARLSPNSNRLIMLKFICLTLNLILSVYKLVERERRRTRTTICRSQWNSMLRRSTAFKPSRLIYNEAKPRSLLSTLYSKSRGPARRQRTEKERTCRALGTGDDGSPGAPEEEETRLSAYDERRRRTLAPGPNPGLSYDA